MLQDERSPLGMVHPKPPSNSRKRTRAMLNLSRLSTRRRSLIGAAFVVIALALAARVGLLDFVPIRRDQAWICAYTGSVKSRTVFLSMVTTSTSFERSPLEKYVRSHQEPVAHRWVRVKDTIRYVSGRRKYQHERAPAIHYVPYSEQKRFIESASDKDVASFLRDLRDSPYAEGLVEGLDLAPYPAPVTPKELTKNDDDGPEAESDRKTPE